MMRARIRDLCALWQLRGHADGHDFVALNPLRNDQSLGSFKVALDGTVLGIIGRSGRQLKQFSGVHQLACPSENEVYAAETSNWRVQKLILQPRPRAVGSATARQ